MRRPSRLPIRQTLSSDISSSRVSGTRPATARASAVASRKLRIEALEDRRVLAVLTVNSLADDTTSGDGLVTLREAIVAANDDETTDAGQTGAGADAIEFDPSLFTGGPGQITLTGGQLDITSEVSITGPGINQLTISGNNASRVFNIDDGDGDVHLPVAVSDVRIIEGFAAGAEDEGNGGALFSTESLTLRRASIESSVAANAGGGLFAAADNGAVIDLADSTISGNSALVDHGGGAAVSAANYGVASLTNLTIQNNSAESTGGGLALLATYNGAAALTGSTVSGNNAAFGGGLHVEASASAEALIAESTVTGNTAAGDGSGYAMLGGGISVDSSYLGTATVAESDVTSNFGGGIAVSNSYQGRFDLRESTIANNVGVGANNFGGGGIQIDAQEQSILNIARSEISGNANLGPDGEIGADGGSGGGIYLRGYLAAATIEDSTVADNSSSDSGAGIYAYGYMSDMAVINSTISGNEAANSGGGLYIYNGEGASFQLQHSTVTGNQADVANSGYGYGGGVFVSAGEIDIDHAIVAGNASNSPYGPDLFGEATIQFTLVGNDSDATLTLTGSGNLVGTSSAPIDPLLDPLADLGGPTLTHALQTGSPARDAGDPNISGAPQHDQRGAPFARVSAEIIDMGAFEVQSSAPSSADFDGDLDVDGRDLLAWQLGFGLNNGAAKTDGDADNDGDVDADDLVVWHETYGDAAAIASAASSLPGNVDFSVAAVAVWSADEDREASPALEEPPAVEGTLDLPARDRAFSAIGSARRDSGEFVASHRARPTVRGEWIVGSKDDAIE